jgi:hypothetical protein
LTATERRRVRRSIVFMPDTPRCNGATNGAKDMKHLTRLALAAAMLASASGAYAQTETFARSGAWTAFHGRNNAGSLTCGMSIVGAEGRIAMIKWQSTDSGLFVHIGKDGWSIPLGVEMPIEIQFDRMPKLEGMAASRTDKGQYAKMIEIWIKKESEIASFMDNFMAADKMYVSFPGGSEKPWVAKMDGSETIGRHFKHCVADFIAEGEKKSTQPFGSTQPHSPTSPRDGGKASQPFGNNNRDRI